MNKGKVLTSQISEVTDKLGDSTQAFDASNGIRDLFYNEDNMVNFREIGDGWYKLANDKATELLIKLFSDRIVNDILTSLMDGPLTIPQILQASDSPQTSTYRKFGLLIDYGIVRPKRYLGKEGGKRVHSYYSTIKGIRIEVDRRTSLSIKLN